MDERNWKQNEWWGYQRRLYENHFVDKLCCLKILSQQVAISWNDKKNNYYFFFWKHNLHLYEFPDVNFR